ncbi:MAG: hypothetical protein AAGE59_26155 [Cyanobacteria bacterium P01_F01_bin.86]
MYPQGSNNYQINFSGLGCWLAVIAVIWLLGAAGLNWLVGSLALLLAFLFIAPVLLFIGFRWWLKRNLIQGSCPACGTPLTGLRKAQIACPNCRTALQITKDGFERFTPDGTVEVSAVNVTDNSENSTDVVEVAVEVLPPADGDR